MSSPLSGELAGVFFLNQATTHSVVATGGSRAAARLLACAFLPFHTAEAVEHTLTSAEQVTREAPCYDLWFAPDSSLIGVLTRYLHRG